MWNAQTGMHIKDVTWAGGSAIPPTGRPPKTNMKVLTLTEEPYMKYSELISSTCPTIAEPCYVVKAGNNTG